jgi:hypothetical protein
VTARVSARCLIAVVAAACAALLSVATPAPAAPALDPAQLTLRLSDLGPGYSADYGPCERWPNAHQFWPRSLQRLAAGFGRRGCRIRFDQVWRKPDPARPAGIDSDAFIFDSTAGPEAATLHARALLALAIGADRPDVAPIAPAGTIGDETHVFKVDSYEGPGMAVMWRSGPVLALVHAVGRREAITQAVVLQLAAAQQARVASPTPLLPADLDGLEVPLDDPNLRLPVQWLGRELPARGGRPALSLIVVSGPARRPLHGEPHVTLQYGHPFRGGMNVDVIIELWRRPAAARRGIRAASSRRCLRRYDGGRDDVPATIFGSYEPRRARCEQGPPEVWAALALFRGVAVTVEAIGCSACRPGNANYDSLAGLRAVLGALHPRTAP